MIEPTLTMNVFVFIGILLLGGYFVGNLFEKIGIPKIVGFIAVGILFSPDTLSLVEEDFVQITAPIQKVCLAFITFEVGGALKWSKIKQHGKEILYITLLASIFPFIIVSAGIYLFAQFYPIDVLSVELLIPFVLILGALASPTAPEATMAVMHQYHAKGKVSDTIMGVAALDDVVGILLFSVVIAISSTFVLESTEDINSSLFFNAAYQIGGAVILGTLMAIPMKRVSKLLGIKSQGQWIVMIFSVIILCLGLSILFEIDELLACMTMGIVTSNRNEQQEKIFKITERYTEELVFLFFFVLSGLHLDIYTFPKAALIILVFIILRTIGKFLGSSLGGRWAHAAPAIRKYTAGGLLPQGGIVIGLVLSIHQTEGFEEIAPILLTTIMGATVIHELLGPIAAKHTLSKAGEIKAGNSIIERLKRIFRKPGS